MHRKSAGRQRVTSLRTLLLRGFACALLLLPASPGRVLAQTTQDQASAEQFNPEQLDALLAPIALYPDPLLAQVLMASAYPVDIVQAQRWLAEPANKALSGDALVAALASQSWDPSVKSLIPFPQVLATLSSQLEWTQQLGYAFSVQEAAVMDSVQRLRQQAQGSGHLQSSPQQTVTTDAQSIVIQPANPQVVYVPAYNPTVVYGTWPYPAYPPVYYPPPAGYVAGNALLAGLAFGTGVAIVGSLWNVGYPNWRGGSVNVNVNRWNSVNVNRRQISSSTWRPPAGAGRPSGIAGPVGRPARANGLPANAIGRPSVQVPSGLVNRPAAGGANRGGNLGANRPQTGGGNLGANRPQTGGGNLGANRPQTGGGNLGANRPQTGGGNLGANRPQGGANRPQAGAGAGRPQQLPANRPAQRPSQSGAFAGMGEGQQAGGFGARGQQSRQVQQRPAGGGGARAGAARGGAGGGRGGRR